MKKSILIILLFSFNVLFAQDDRKLTIKPIPDWVIPVKVNPEDKINTSEVSDGYLFLLDDVQVNNITDERYFHRIRKIISDEGVQNGSDLSFVYSPSYQKLFLHSLKVTRNGVTTDRTTTAKFKIIQPERRLGEHIYDGNYSAVTFLEDIRKGDEIEYSFSFKGSNPVFEGKESDFIYLNGDSPLLRVYYRLLMPDKKELQIKNDKTEIQCKINTLGNAKEYTWDVSNVAAVKVPSRTPSWYDGFSNVQVTEYKNWSEVKSWADKIFTFPSSSSGNIRKLVEEIKEKHLDPDMQIVAALRFVQNEIRYTGIESGVYSHKPLAPDKVLAQRFGDCKDKSFLLCALLRESGIEAYPALVNAYYKKHIEDFLPSPDDFNHCIVKVIANGKAYWFDPTIANQFGRLGNIYCPDYGKALVLNDTSQTLTDIPKSEPGFTKAEEVFLVKDTLAPGSLIVYTDYEGSDADNFRSEVASSGRSEIEGGFIKFYSSNYPEIELSDSLVIDDDSLQNSIHTIERYNIPHIWESADSLTGKVKIQFYAEIIRSRLFTAGSVSRNAPLAINYPVNIDQKVKIVVGSDWKIKNDDIRIANKWFDFFYTSQTSGDTIELRYSYKSFVGDVEASDISKFGKETDRVLENTGYSVSLKPNPESKGGGATNYLLLIVTLLSLFVFTTIARRVYKWSVVVSFVGNPKPVGGWLVLVMIGLVISPLRVIYFLSTTGYFNQAVWSNLTNESYALYSPLWSFVIPFEVVGNLLTAFLASFCFLLMLKKRDIFPKVMIFYLSSSLVFLLLDYFLARQITAVREQDNSEAMQEITRGFVAAAIWIPYMIISTRVKETFVVPYNNIPGESFPDSEAFLVAKESTQGEEAIHGEQAIHGEEHLHNDVGDRNEISVKDEKHFSGEEPPTG